MINVIHTEHATIAAISNRWFARYPAQWRRMLAIANLLDVPLLALVYARLRDLRDATARDAFERQEDFGVVAWEWREAVAAARRAVAGQQWTVADPPEPRDASGVVSLAFRAAGDEGNVGSESATKGAR